MTLLPFPASAASLTAASHKPLPSPQRPNCSRRASPSPLTESSRLGNKLQRLAMTHPFALRVVEKFVDSLILAYDAHRHASEG